MQNRVVHIVDDDLPVRDSLHWLLRSADIESRVYESPELFLTLTDGQPQGCVLLDMRMPRTNGIEVLKSLAQRGMTAPVIVMTGHGDDIDASEVLRLGATDFLEKPFEAERVLAAIEQAMSGER